MVKKSKLPARFGIAFLLLIIIGTFIYNVWHLTRLKSLTITTLQIEAGKTIPQAELAKIVNKALTGTYLALIPKRFTYTYPKAELINRLTEKPRVKTALVNKTSRTSLSVSVTEYIPYALWCNETKKQNCVFLNHSGFAFATAPQLSGSVFLRYYLAKEEPSVEGSAFTPDFIAMTELFTTLVKDSKGFIVSNITRTEDNDVTYELVSGAKLITTADLSPEQSFDNLLTVLETEEFKHLTQNNFSYIDLRFGNKVYVQEEEPKEETTATATATES